MRLALFNECERKEQETKSVKKQERPTMKGLTCNGFATKSDFGLKTNNTLSPHGVFVT